jgi:protein-glutamine gamma-glutamyltransferase
MSVGMKLAFTITPWQRLRRLPRETRDTLFLLAVIAWTIVPHVSHLPLWCVFLAAAMLLWRAKLAFAHAPLPGRWVLFSMLGVSAGLTYWSFGTVLGKDPGVTMTVALTALKMLEARARRDAFVVFFLGFFLILTHFLYSQSMAVGVAMLVSVWGLLTSLVLANMPVGRPSLKQVGLLSARTALLGAPLMVLMFMLFPRIAPLWGVPKDGATPTGLSNSMRLGSVASVAQDDSVAMRIKFYDGQPSSGSLYFRGPVLAQFDGVEWKALTPSFPAAVTPRAELRVAGPVTKYEVTLEPQRLTVLPLLEATVQVEDIPGLKLRQGDDLQWTAERPVYERLRFDAQAHMTFRHGPQQAVLGLQEHIALPVGFNPRTVAWAQALRSEERYIRATPRVLAQAVLRHIRAGGYSYTLTPGLYGELDPRATIDEFWLDRKNGFCEHFASSFVVVMRAMGVPARIVTGYQGADAEPVDGYTIVRQRYAHAWAEYWQAGDGWVRADPTAAVSPDRIERGRSLAPPPGLVASAFDNINPALMANLRANWEAVNNRWNQWVMNYSRNQQVDLMKRLGLSSTGWEDMVRLLVGALSTLAAGVALWAWWEQRRVDPWTRQMMRLRAVLQRAGISAGEHEGPRSLAQRVRKQLGEQGNAMAALLDQLDCQRYGRHALRWPDAQLTRRFKAAAKSVHVH